MRKLLLLSTFLIPGACQQAGESAAPIVAETASMAPAPAPSPTASAAPALDKSALNEHREPGKLLGYLAEAVNSGMWADAALAWHSAEDGTPMTADKAKALFGNPKAPLISFGPGDQEGAAGSSFYEAPILLIDGGTQKEGTITLRRVNDVDGAEDWQLAWHVERLEWKK
ncbi:MAG: hypothetical protein P0Y56_09190 [Candidatus Andeanibacterium colombiense]|uniref:Uncharacterized protein n=1 Tax=Candidatus Andeanibacterium colombiense TaxID=3121345 RepID=A0AAJ5X075_9SPHN|nr:MAG: hypothetical protein P0Y56_09190 [Sphingomonadaceae bacterium]